MHDLPDDPKVDVKVSVDQAVPQADDLVPRQVSTLSAQLLRETARCLTNDLKLTDHAVLDQSVLGELAIGHTSHVGLDLGDSVQDMAEENCISLALRG